MGSKMDLSGVRERPCAANMPGWQRELDYAREYARLPFAVEEQRENTFRKRGEVPMSKQPTFEQALHDLPTAGGSPRWLFDDPGSAV